MAVKKGDLLIKIKPDSYKALVEQQLAGISAAKAINLQQKASMAKAEHDLKRNQDLYDKKMISELEFTTSATAFDVAKSTYESSQHEIERAEAGSSQARDQLSKTTIYSPIDGTVTVLNSKLGERVVATNQFAGTEVLRVADLSHMQAVVDVNENDVVNVKIDDKATISIDAYGDRKFTGTVQQIANTGKTTGAGTQEEVTNFEVKIRILDQDVRLRPGLSCTAEIETSMVKDAVAVPMQSVTIRTGDSNLSPEEIEKRKQKQVARDKADNNADVTDNRQVKAAQKEEREKLAKVVFLKKGNKAEMVKGGHRHCRRHLHGNQKWDCARRRSDFGKLQRHQSKTERRRQGHDRKGNDQVERDRNCAIRQTSMTPADTIRPSVRWSSTSKTSPSIT